jgi:uncharacterized membrane protein YkgB
MKIVIKIVLTLVILLVISGYTMQYLGYEKGDVVIGIGILCLAFILMPLFLIQRLKGKDLSQYIDNGNLIKRREDKSKDID